jgi:hypothetical protein
MLEEKLMVTQSTTPKMSSPKKKHLSLKIVLSIIVLILIILTVLPLIINPIAETLVKQQITPIFGNKLKIGSVNVSFLTGAVVKINQIELAQAPGYGKGNLLQADSIKFRVALLPLLNKQLFIKDITIIRPEIQIIQYRNGHMNLDYYQALFTEKSSSKASNDSNFAIKLNRFILNNGKILFSSYAISRAYQPTFVLTQTYLNLKNIAIPNLDKLATPFYFSALLGTNRLAKITAEGTAFLGGSAISFTVKSKVSDLALADYAYLVPNSSVTIQSGQAWINSDTNCNNNYLNSYQHVDIKDLQMAPKRGHAFGGNLLGTPANILLKGIEDGKGRLNFVFILSGHLDDLKANVKFKVIEAVTKSLRDKLGLNKISNAAASGVKKAGNKVVNAFNGIFKHKK